MLKIYTTIFFLIFLNVSAEVIQKLEIKGNDRIGAETIKVYGEINIGEDYSSFDIDKILKNLYKTNFFKDIKISLSNGVLNITVEEYAMINFIDIQGEESSKIKKKVLETLKLQPKQSFIENNLSQDINTIKKIYASIGFNFTDVEAKLERFENNRINLIYFLDKGKKTNIAKINFIGDKKVKDKRLRDIIVSEEKKFWKFLSKNTFLSYNNIELDKRLLINYFKSIGYYDVQVLSDNAEISKKNLTNLTYTINAGTRYRVNKISTNVSEVLDKKLFFPLQENFTKVIGKYYSPFRVKELLDELDTLIANNDLQFIEHSVNEILENDSIEIKINIYEGKKELVEKINIIGNTVTDESVIRAEFLLDEGDPFNNLKLDQSIAKLKSRNLFGEIKNKIIEGSTKDQKIIEIEVEEKPTGEISAGAGVGTNGGSFAFNISENNWLGKGIGISTNVEVSAESFTGGLSITDPNYNYSGNSLTYFIENTSNDKPTSGYKNNIISTGLGTSFEQYKDVYLSPRLTLSYDDLKVDNSASKSMQKQKGTFTDLSFDYGVTVDNRDRAYAPTDGYISSFNQGVPIYADSPYIKNSYAFSKYKTITANAIGTFKIYGSAINGLSNEDVRISKRVNLNNKRLRGFKSGQVGPKDGQDYIGGNYAMATNFEVALPNFLPESTKTDVGFFLDFGNVWNVDYDPAIDDSNKIRSSTGINTSWLSPVGPMTFVFSRNLSKASTDVTEGFNFRLGTSF
jgi:outer membrane protein insertion porin family